MWRDVGTPVFILCTADRLLRPFVGAAIGTWPTRITEHDTAVTPIMHKQAAGLQELRLLRQ